MAIASARAAVCLLTLLHGPDAQDALAVLLGEIFYFARDMDEIAIRMQHMGILELAWGRDGDRFGGLAHDGKLDVRVHRNLQLSRCTDGLVAIYELPCDG